MIVPDTRLQWYASVRIHNGSTAWRCQPPLQKFGAELAGAGTPGSSTAAWRVTTLQDPMKQDEATVVQNSLYRYTR